MYTVKVEGDTVEFNSRDMDEDVIYPFDAWGGHYAVRKRKGSIDFMEFVPANILLRFLYKLKQLIC